jgi:hypothetical protein
MNTNSGRAGRWMGWRPISVMAFALLLALLFGVQVSHAQSGGDLCLRDAAGFDNPNICRANDVRIIEFSMESSLESCVAGDTIDVTLRVKLRPGASTRYDIGLYIAEDGGNAMDRDAVCYRDYLQPVSDDNLDLNLVDGYGPFFNGEIGASAADFCGDIERRQDAVYVMSPVRITCTDGDGDGPTTSSPPAAASRMLSRTRLQSAETRLFRRAQSGWSPRRRRWKCGRR